MARIYFHNLNCFIKTAREARARGLYPSLSTRLHQMQEWGRGRQDKDTKVVIGYDFADMSFGFYLINPGDEQPCMAGGLIFHPGSTGLDRSMSVELSPASEPHWSIHT